MAPSPNDALAAALLQLKTIEPHGLFHPSAAGMIVEG
jgi:hypothetical protein